MAKMKAARVAKPGSDFEIVTIEIPEPGDGQVRMRVLASGICHSDVFTKEGLWPGIQYPRVPGHEVAGIIDKVAPGVTGWKEGQRVGVGWLGWYCGHCRACRGGDFASCPNAQVTGINFDGGHEEYMIAPETGLAALPEHLADEDAAPLMCAGLTTYNALRHSGALPGDLVAVQAIGGLGHLGIQFANKFGYRVVAIGRGTRKAQRAIELGAHRYIDAQAVDAAEELQKMGGARVILSTAPSAKAMAGLVEGLGANGKMMVIGASQEPIEVTPGQLIHGRRSLQGWPSGTAADAEDTLNFAELTGVRPVIERFPLERANEAYGRMISGKAEFRVVLTMPSR